MGEIFKRFTDWERSPLIRLASRFTKKPEKKLLKVMEIGQDRLISNVSVCSLLSAARDSKPEVRVRAIMSIREIRDPESVPDLICMLKDEDSAIRCATANAIRGIGLNEGQFRSIAKLLSEAETVEEKRKIIIAFAEIGDPRAITILAEDYKSKPEGPLPEAVWVLIAINRENPIVIDSIPCLFRLLYEKNSVREATKKNVAQMLGYVVGLCNTKGSIELLLKRLDEAQEEARKYPWPSSLVDLCLRLMRSAAVQKKEQLSAFR